MIGSQIGSYKILEKLGEGGMGVVYKAVDTSLDRIVAVKSLSAELAHNPDLEKRFRAEAKAQANLNHTNIATLYAFLVESGGAWMVMEYIEGESLATMIERRGVIPWQEAIPIFKQALLGIGYAHRMGIVHRDIKPSNIMVNRQGMVKVMDFGIAKVLGNRGMTRTGTQMGTAYYMSPEQVVNKGVDIRSDIYSLGVTLYEMLTANVPFTGDTDFEVMQAHMQTPPPLPTRFYPYIPKGLENAVLQAMEKNQNARFQTVEEFGAALEHPENYQPRVASPATAGPPIAGATRLEAATQTIGSVAGTPAATPAPAPMGATPPPAPLPVRPSLLASRNAKLMAAAGAAVIVLGVTAALVLRPKPQPTPAPAPPIGQLTAPPAGSEAQPPIELPAPTAPPVQAPAPPPANQPAQQKARPVQANATHQPPPAPAPAPAAPAPAQATNGTQAQTPPPAPVQTLTPPAAAPAPAPAPVPAAGPVVIPAGTRIVVRTIGLISTRSSREGATIPAAVDAPVVAAGRTVIPRGADVSLRVASLAEGISLDLAGLTVGARQYVASAESYTARGDDKEGIGTRVVGGLRKLKPFGRRSSEPEAIMISPGSRLTFTLKQPLQVVAP